MCCVAAFSVAANSSAFCYELAGCRCLLETSHGCCIATCLVTASLLQFCYESTGGATPTSGCYGLASLMPSPELRELPASVRDEPGCYFATYAVVAEVLQ